MNLFVGLTIELLIIEDMYPGRSVIALTNSPSAALTILTPALKTSEVTDIAISLASDAQASILPALLLNLFSAALKGASNFLEVSDSRVSHFASIS